MEEEINKPKKIKPPKRNPRAFLERSIERISEIKKYQTLSNINSCVDEFYADLKYISNNRLVQKSKSNFKVDFLEKELIYLEKTVNSISSNYKEHFAYSKSLHMDGSNNFTDKLTKCKELYDSLQHDIVYLQRKSIFNAFKIKKLRLQDKNELYESFDVESEKDLKNRNGGFG